LWYALVACQFCKGDMWLWNYWWLCLTKRLCCEIVILVLLCMSTTLFFVYPLIIPPLISKHLPRGDSQNWPPYRLVDSSQFKLIGLLWGP
jgi:hypothetical protein